VAQEQLEQDETTERDSGGENGSSGGSGFKTAAAASVAAGLSYLVAKRALDQRGSGESGSSGGDEKQEPGDTGGGGGSSRTSDSLRTAADMVTWDRAREMLLPMAERAAGAVGSYVARETPEVVSERLVPRFIDAFNKARPKQD
jgi:hypothetical protein